MATPTDPWYVTERGEWLAGALLTLHPHVHIRGKNRTDLGLELLVEIRPDRGLSTRLFVVQVKATTSSRREDWIEGVEELYKLVPTSIFLPTCLFILNVRDNESFFAWVAEPLIEPNGVGLQLRRPEAFADLDRAAVAEIVERVKAWYEAMPRQLQPS